MKRSTIILCILFMSSLSYGQDDWPNLQRFEKSNELTMTQSDQDTFRIVFMGDSITEGWSNFDSTFFDNHTYINRGIGGQTTPQMLIRFRQDVVHLNANSVIILAGINDIAGNTGPSTLSMIVDNLSSMVEIALTNGIHPIICSVLPANYFPWQQKIDPSQKVIELNDLLKTYAEKMNVMYVDYYSAMVNDKQGLKEHLGYDPVHPNAAGYAVMRPIIEQAIQQLKASH